jgi:nitroreductase
MNFKNFIAIIIFTTLIIFFSICNLSGQTAIIRGFVYEKETGEPVIFTNVYLANTTFGSATDVNGYYIISNIPSGNYELMVTYLGYDTLRMSITLKPDEIVNKKLYLK